MKRASSPYQELDKKQPRTALDTIKLNVGGRRFQTTSDTLRGVPFFEPLLEQRLPYAADDKAQGRLLKLTRDPQ